MGAQAGARGPCSCPALPLASLCPTDQLSMDRQEAAPWDLLAVRLHLDNGTMLPTAAVRLRWQVGVMPGCPHQRTGHGDEAGATSPVSHHDS